MRDSRKLLAFSTRFYPWEEIGFGEGKITEGINLEFRLGIERFDWIILARSKCVSGEEMIEPECRLFQDFERLKRLFQLII